MSEQSTSTQSTVADATAPASLGAPAAQDDSTDTSTEGRAAAQVAIAAAQPRGVAVESTTLPGDQRRANVVIARGPQDQPERGIYEGEAMIVSAHRDEGQEPPLDVRTHGAVADAPTPKGKRS